MKKMSIMFVAALALAAGGCSKKGGADCSKAIANGMEVGKATLPTSDEKMMTKLREVGVKRCHEDKWSDDVIKCMIDAKTEAEGQSCYGKLTPEQQSKMNNAAMEGMSPPNAGSGKPAPAADGSGSATGSGSAAGSGSAGAP
ncbi:MAG TPA: hypothetical protein VGO00_01775 [Kofleriaceae bacterium]|nr:hypothetical protein [Kofleriaceae bacterium]